MVSSLTSLSHLEKVGRVWKQVPGVVISARECQVGRTHFTPSGEERETSILLSTFVVYQVCTSTEEGMGP